MLVLSSPYHSALHQRTHVSGADDPAHSVSINAGRAVSKPSLTSDYRKRLASFAVERTKLTGGDGCDNPRLRQKEVCEKKIRPPIARFIHCSDDRACTPHIANYHT